MWVNSKASQWERKHASKSNYLQHPRSDIECTDDVKLLGVILDFKLNFDKHISTLCKKAARQINVLHRIGKHLPINCRKVIYQSFILSAFIFFAVIWNFCSELNNKKLEKLNHRALRHVYHDYDSNYEILLAKDDSVSRQHHGQ